MNHVKYRALKFFFDTTGKSFLRLETFDKKANLPYRIQADLKIIRSSISPKKCHHYFIKLFDFEIPVGKVALKKYPHYTGVLGSRHEARASCVVHLIADGLIARSPFPPPPSPWFPHPSFIRTAYILPTVSFRGLQLPLSSLLRPAMPEVGHLVTSGRLVNISIHPSRVYLRTAANWPSCNSGYYAIFGANMIVWNSEMFRNFDCSFLRWILKHEHHLHNIEKPQIRVCQRSKVQTIQYPPA